MIPYLLCFSIAIIFSYLSELYLNKNKGAMIFFALLCVLVLGGLAGTRDLFIGGDLRIYGIREFAIANESTSFGGLLGANDGMEIGYSALNFIISRFVNSMNGFLFVFGLLEYGIMYMGMIQFRKYCSIPLQLYVYLFLLYPTTFNLIRQSFACSIIFLAFGLYINNKKASALFLFLLAPFFHSSAIIGLPMIILWFFFEKSEKKHDKTILCFLLVFSIVIALFGSSISDYLINSGMISSKYTMYMSTSTYGSQMGNNVGIISIFNLYRLVFVVIYLVNWKTIKDNKLFLFFFVMTVLDFIFTVLLKGSSGAVVARIGFYFTWFLPTGYFLSINALKNTQIKRALTIMTLILLTIIGVHILLSSGVTSNSGQFYPYTSKILGLN